MPMFASLRTRSLALFALFVAFTGCITIEENYSFKKDGSGTMEYVVDMSAIGDMMKAFEDFNKDNKKEDGDVGTMDLKEEVSALKGIPGIKKVKVNDREKYVQRLKFAFADVNALNAALNVLMKDSTGSTHTFFRWEGNTLVRTTNDHARQIGAGMGGGDAAPGDTTDMTQVLSSMKYKYRFSFAEPIAATNAAEGVTTESTEARTVNLATDFAVIAKDEKALDLRIELKR